MKQVFKLFMINREPYLTVDEDVKIGDFAIVAVNDMYPTLVECKNDEQIDLIQRPQTSLTKRHKVILKPKEVKLEDSQIESLILRDGPVLVEVEDGEITILE